MPAPIQQTDKEKRMTKTKTAPRKMHDPNAACKCVEQVNEKLKAHNTRLFQFPTADRSKAGLHLRLSLGINTEKIDSRIRAAKKIVMPTYCPFCGKKL